MTSTLIEDLLAEQHCLTPVARFAREHDRKEHGLADTYQDLIPLSAPKPGEQYAFAVDLDRCTGCKACVAACHSLNGLDEEETWREVGTLIGGTELHPRMQTVTSACHHCAEPGCLEGCPVLAYEKDEETGIVRHLDDQCIGCSYCVLKCPYEVPKYSKKLGIVRKCDMCHSRLAVGEAPACVQACPTSAISIRTISIAEVRANAENLIFLPDSPDPNITVPTTTYTSNKPLSEWALAANHHRPKVQHTHWPLVFMLVLTQAGVGAIIGALSPYALPWTTQLAALLFFAGLGCSVLHLGQPLKAWRAFLGWRTSWLSREIIAFGMVSPFFAVAAAMPFIAPLLPDAEILTLPANLAVVAGMSTGVLAVICSAYVYHDTHRLVWCGPLSFLRFALTVGIFAALFAGTMLPAITILVTKFGGELLLVLRGLFTRLRLDDLDRSARLLRGPLLGWTITRFGFGALALFGLSTNLSLWFVLVCVLVGEVLERALFFKAGISTRMPGT